MAHHSTHEDDSILRAVFGKQLPAAALGATGEFPQGKLADDDEGEIRFAVAADKNAGKVIIDFGSPVTWVGMDPEQASQLGDTLRKKADECSETEA